MFFHVAQIDWSLFVQHGGFSQSALQPGRNAVVAIIDRPYDVLTVKNQFVYPDKPGFVEISLYSEVNDIFIVFFCFYHQFFEFFGTNSSIDQFNKQVHRIRWD